MNPDQFDSELKTYYRKIKSEIKTQHQDYIAKHPELREILNDFLSQVLLEKPTNVYDYAQEYYSYFNIDKDKIKFKPLIITGPSGAGKTNLIKKIIEKYPEQFEKSISYTTRAPLLNETHGVEYYFVSKNEFEKEKEKSSFLEYIQNSEGKYFGTHLGKLDAIINSGKVCILEVDIRGAKAIHEKFNDWSFIFLNTPNEQIREERLKQRGIYSEEEIQKRLEKGKEEVRETQQCVFVQEINNKDIDEAYQQTIDHIKQNYNDLNL